MIDFNNWESEISIMDQKSIPEARKILRNSLYLTFNAPEVDDYVCELVLPPSLHHEPYLNTPSDIP